MVIFTIIPRRTVLPIVTRMAGFPSITQRDFPALPRYRAFPLWIGWWFCPLWGRWRDFPVLSGCLSHCSPDWLIEQWIELWIDWGLAGIKLLVGTWNVYREELRGCYLSCQTGTSLPDLMNGSTSQSRMYLPLLPEWSLSHLSPWL